MSPPASVCLPADAYFQHRSTHVGDDVSRLTGAWTASACIPFERSRFRFWLREDPRLWMPHYFLRCRHRRPSSGLPVRRRHCIPLLGRFVFAVRRRLGCHQAVHKCGVLSGVGSSMCADPRPHHRQSGRGAGRYRLGLDWGPSRRELRGQFRGRARGYSALARTSGKPVVLSATETSRGETRRVRSIHSE